MCYCMLCIMGLLILRVKKHTYVLSMQVHTHIKVNRDILTSNGMRQQGVHNKTMGRKWKLRVWRHSYSISSSLWLKLLSQSSLLVNSAPIFSITTQPRSTQSSLHKASLTQLQRNQGLAGAKATLLYKDLRRCIQDRFVLA